MKKLVTIIIVAIYAVSYGQTTIDETAIPSTGISYQNGPGTSNEENWTYPYSVKLSVFGNIHRNFELANTSKTGTTTLAMRTYNGETSSWSDWREFLFKNQNGYVGIGTSSPNSLLDINGTGDGTELLRFSTERPWVFRQLNSGASSRLDLHSTVGSKNFLITSPNNSIAAQFMVSDNQDGSRVFLVPDGGKVGVGTTSFGSHTFVVDGTVGAREIRVESGSWSDFVFESGYALPSLRDVENHIKENGHLQDIPSAKEVVANGFFLGEMDAKLLQKIEELTLYTIQQEKKIKELELMNQKLLELQERIELLESKK
ncbi:DUF4200 domain-containing protein [Aquimarina pacifica]|uniref:DUF4200 domain-containing protein n=1 Tax=Aquimarina pacifica TaxID=1296415 RepID=UPI000470F746|nr:DUF4200 domain-containing protein [Aquimarina pacifica]